MATHTPQLGRRFLVAAATLAILLAVGAGLIARRGVRATVARLAAQRGLEVATHAGTALSHYSQAQRRLTEVLAASPELVAAAEAAATRAVALGLDRPGAPGQLPRDAAIGGYLVAAARHAGFAEAILTERHGHVVATTAPRASVVHADQPWWQDAMASDQSAVAAQYDSALGSVALNVAAGLRGARGQTVGVLRTVSPLADFRALLARSVAGDGATLDVVDSSGRLVIAPEAVVSLQPLADADLVPRAAQPTVQTVGTSRGTELIASVPVPDGEWWVVFRQPRSAALAAAATTLRAIYGGLAALLVVAAVFLWQLLRWVERRVTRPVRRAGAIAARVADGDLAVTVAAEGGEAAEVAELTGALRGMLAALRRLVGTIRTTADEAAAMAAEISASTQQMTASTEEMASTCQDLSQRSADQSQLVRAAADDAAKVLEIASVLASGAEDSVRRNAAVAATAQEHRTHLDQSAQALARLADEVERGFQEADALAQASEQIQKFVTQTKAIAMQTNMLALNAAIEAARAGQQGRGFAVVADEVRKLASVAAVAATETAETMGGVLARVRANRDRLARLAEGGAAARAVAEGAARGLGAVTSEAQANDAWSREIAMSAGEVRALVDEIVQRLQALAQGTDSLLASTEEIAASSEQQSASTEEIASSANQLATAADQLTAAVKTFRLSAPAGTPATPRTQ